MNQIVELTKQFLKTRFSLSKDKANEDEIVESIKKGIEFSGINVWVLIFAIFLASIGLNVNATAVIIGAMLISPLMGPIMGIGLGVGIFDFDLIKSAGKNLAIMVIISLTTSTVYFLISPLDVAQSELLSRTTPTIWDVLIAFFGGLAGIVAGSSKSKGTVIPGVAIATALMPPLCTAGFGLARGDFYFFGGAIYLFCINTVFISVSTFLVVRLLKFRKASYIDKGFEKKVQKIVSAIVIVTIVPSLFIAYLTVKKAVFQQRTQNFIHGEFQFPNTQLISQKINYEKNQITIVLIGDKISEEQLEIIRQKSDNYNLHGLTVNVKQGLGNSEIDLNNLKEGIIDEVYAQNKNTLDEKNKIILNLQKELNNYKAQQFPIKAISKEAQSLNYNIELFSIQKMSYYDMKNEKSDTLVTVYGKFKVKPHADELRKFTHWLKARTNQNSLKLIIE